MEAIIAERVHKSYRRLRKPTEKALAGLDLEVSAGGVHGFLGPNGSGKTTTIRALLGAVRVDSGRLRLLGHDVPAELPRVLARVGALVETPLFFPDFSARLNLRLLADTAGVGQSRLEQCLEIVDLRDRADDRFKSYSLGMKQRLGIAAALLKSPSLLVLDEPSNGLDPAGMRDVRELIRRLGADGQTTVFLSSHLLSEVQQVCDRVTILARGRCVATGSVHEVLTGRATGDVRLRTSDLEGTRRVLELSGLSVTSMDDALRVHAVSDPSQLTRLLAERGHFVSELTAVAVDLESVFLDLTRDKT